MHKIAFINPTGRFPADVQLAGVKAYKPNAIVSTKDNYTAADLVKIARKGNQILVHGVGRLGRSQIAVREALIALGEKGVVVFDTKFGIEVSAQALAALAEGYREVTGELRLPGSSAILNAKKSVKVRRAAAVEGKSDGDAEAAWKDRKIPTDPIAAAMIGLSTRTLTRRFGKSGRPPGRRKGAKMKIKHGYRRTFPNPNK